MDMPKSPQTSSSRPVEKVIVHPLVLLSIADHYNRIAKKTLKRVVGVLLGTSFQGIVDVSNSYAVPFEEAMNPGIWFLDHNYHEAMLSMFKKIKAKEHVVGWYSTGRKLQPNDPDIHSLFHNYVPNPVLVIIDVRSREFGIPTKANYDDVEEVKDNPTQKSQKVFVHVPSEIAVDEVEEIGVEHLLRDVKDTTIISTLAIEDMFSRCPNLDVSDELKKAFAVKRNDMMLVIYLRSLIRCVIALHNLINNKILYKEHEKAEDAKPVEVPAGYDGVP